MKDEKIIYMICNDNQIKMTRDVFDYLMTIKHYNKKLKEHITNLQEELKLERAKNKSLLNTKYGIETNNK